MERFSTSDLRNKEVINLCDGKNLGCPGDFMIDLPEGRICAIIVLRPSGFLWLGHDHDIVIPWSKIECIGDDAILVRINYEECCVEKPCKKKRKC